MSSQSRVISDTAAQFTRDTKLGQSLSSTSWVVSSHYPKLRAECAQVLTDTGDAPKDGGKNQENRCEDCEEDISRE